MGVVNSTIQLTLTELNGRIHVADPKFWDKGYVDIYEGTLMHVIDSYVVRDIIEDKNRISTSIIEIELGM